MNDPACDPESCTKDATAADAGRVRQLPKEVGVLLVTAGIGGLILPGPVGSPFLIAGCVILWPKAFARVETFFERKFPRMHREGVKQMRRYLNDLERRYPTPR